MLFLSSTPSYVRYISADSIEVEAHGREHIRPLKSLGGRRGWLLRSRFNFPFANEQEKVKILHELRDVGIAFLTYDHGWPPGAIFEDLREKGLIEGTYTQISFCDGGPKVTKGC